VVFQCIWLGGWAPRLVGITSSAAAPKAARDRRTASASQTPYAGPRKGVAHAVGEDSSHVSEAFYAVSVGNVGFEADVGPRKRRCPRGRPFGRLRVVRFGLRRGITPRERSFYAVFGQKVGFEAEFRGFGEFSTVLLQSGSITSEPGVITSDPGAITSGAGVITSGAGAITSGAGVITSDVGAITSDVGAITSDPGVITSDAGAITSDAGAITSDPGVITSDPGAITSDTGAITSGRGGVTSLGGAAASQSGTTASGCGGAPSGGGINWRDGGLGFWATENTELGHRVHGARI